MPTSDKPAMTRAVVLRGIGFAAAIALGAVAAWLVVTGDDQRTLRIGMLVGLWGLVLGAYSMFGARRGMGVDTDDDPGRQIALREARQLERQDDADARRDWESRLERLISREVSTAIGRETAALRNEIAHLRQELLDKVGGQLRLERIETTRLIGSDLEALQHEVRQLKDANGQPAAPGVRELLAVSNDPRLSVRPVVEPARVRPVSRSTAEVERNVRPAVADTAETAAIRDEVASAAAPEAPEAPKPSVPASAPSESAAPAPRAPATPATPASATPASPTPAPATPTPSKAEPDAAAARVHRAPAATPPAPRPATAQPVSPQPPPAPTSQPAPQPAPQPTSDRPSGDPFAGLPRLSRFTDFVPETPNGNGHNGNGHNRNGHNGNGNGNGNGKAPEYTGRRRRAEDDDEPGTEPGGAPPPQANGSHADASHADASHADASLGGASHVDGTEPAGRRRRRDDSDESTEGGDLLARLLARQSPEH